MKIAYLYGLHAFPPKGGNHVHAYELTQGFIKAGHEVLVLNDPTMPGSINYDGGTPGAVERFVGDCDVLYVRVDARYLSDWPEVKQCVEGAGKKPVIWEVNAPANETLAFSWLGGRRAGIKESPWKAFKRWLHATRKIPGILKEERLRRSIARNVDAAICVSSALGRYASEALNIPEVLVLPNGGPLISVEEIEKRRAKRINQQFTVFYSGSAIYPWQGLDFLAGAIKLAEKSAPDIRFVLAVNQVTDALPTGANVEVREKLNREQILDAICTADACVALHPEYSWSKWGFHGSPMKMFEYMGCMSPVIASDRGQMADLITHGDNGLLCSDAPDSILNELLFLKENGAKSKAIGASGRQWIVNGHCWQDNADLTLELFSKLKTRCV
ncbi:glycosyltransferase family 4 protein [Marinobacter salarius]|uniref:Glycosyl transferases group 1 n=1 Tax=Marinobacter salarius TaxID=1420917 RepID=A0A1W6K9F7_9GAMM|nr:glycosyltransferase family 4 protein [Marinobacter salarius]ARM84047.1 glycosyl transferases group 1 [Marinobacter salarius]